MGIEKSRLKLNFAVLLVAQIYTQGLAALSGVLVVRFLGPVEYGRYALAVAGLNLGAVIADAGLSAYLGREAARLPAPEGLRLWKRALQVRLGLSALVGIATIGLVWLEPSLGQPALAGLAGLSLFPMSAVILATAFLNGQGRAPVSGGLNALVGTISFGLALVGLAWQPLAWTILLATLSANMVGAILLTRPLLISPDWLEKGQPALSPSALLGASRSFLLIGLASIIFQYADIYLVSFLLDGEAVGQYGAALRLLTLVTTIPTVWGIAAVPRFARQPARMRGELVGWGWALGASGVGLAIVGLFLSGPVVGLLLGSKYEAAGRALAWLLWAGAAIFASAAPVTWLTITNRQHLILVALLCADGLGLVLTLVMGGWLRWGLEGVALARVGTSWALCGLYLLFCRSRRLE